jgi:hypothetical protein
MQIIDLSLREMGLNASEPPPMSQTGQSYATGCWRKNAGRQAARVGCPVNSPSLVLLSKSPIRLRHEFSTSALAPRPLGQKIEAIQRDTTGAVTAIGEIGAIINQISDIQTTIASAVEE